MSTDSPQPEARTIVIVEDNPHVADSLQMLLELDGHQVLVAHDGPSALEMVRTRSPDVVLCDLGLEGPLTGYDLCRLLREDEALEGLRIVAMTGYGRENFARRAREAGFDEFLLKPVEPSRLTGLLRTTDRAAPSLCRGDGSTPA